MSSKTRILAFAVAFALVAGFGFAAKADVTGSFSTHISVRTLNNIVFHQTQGQQTPTPITVTPNNSEIQPLAFDVQNALNVNVVISGLSTGFHAHFGLAGVEDVQWSYAATLGALDIEGTVVFGRFTGACPNVGAFAGGLLNLPFCFEVDPDRGITGVGDGDLVADPTPESDDLEFIKKRVKTSISLGGVTFENLAMVEDTNFRFGNPAAGIVSDIAFGDVISLSGQTPSGVSVKGETGICAEARPNVIKKHWWPYRVNADCATDDYFFFNEHEEGAAAGSGEQESSLDPDGTEVDGVHISETVDYTDNSPTSSVSDGDTVTKTFTFDNTTGASKTLEGVITDSANASITSNTCQVVQLAPNAQGVTCSVSYTVSFDQAETTETTLVQVRFNPEDTDAAKPDLMFDFEKLHISGVPIAEGLTGEAVLFCFRDFDCVLENSITWSSGAPLPVEFSFTLGGAGTLFEFGGYSVTLSSGIGTFTVSDTTGDTAIDEVNAVINTTLNPDTNPANLTLDALITPGVGFTDFDAELNIERKGVTFGAAVDFESTGATGVATFNTITFNVGTSVGVFDLESTATFSALGFDGADTTFTINF